MKDDITGTTEALAQCEQVIERGIRSFVEVGAALLKIREERLYLATHKTFDQYCRERWNWRKSYANYQISAAEIVQGLTSAVVIPEYENQVRPLSVLPPEEREAAWNIAVEQSKTGKPTGPEVANVVRAHFDIRTYRTKDEVEAMKTMAAAKKIQAEADQVRLKQFMIFRTLIDSVKFVAEFSMDSDNAWNGVWNAGGKDFENDLRKAQVCLARLEREHPNNKKYGPILHLSKKESIP